MLRVDKSSGAEMAKVMHLLPAFDTGGAERALVRLLGGGLADEFDSHVVSMRGDGAMREAFMAVGASVHLLGARGPAALPWELASLGRRIGFQIVQGWMYHANFAASVLSPVLKPVATLWNIRQSLDDIGGDKFLTRQMIRVGRALSGHPDKILYNSARSAQQHHAFGYRADKSLVIPNGFETDNVLPDAELGDRVRAGLGLPLSAPLFIHIARYHPMKDHRGFVSAGGMVLDAVPEARFLMIGRGVDAAAGGLLADLPSEKRAHFNILGETKDIVRFLQAADVLVVSSKRAEGFPNVIGEAMMTATPVIATDTGDCADILGASGAIVPAGKAECLARVMVAHARDREACRRRGHESRKRVESVFPSSVAVARYRDLYRGLLAGV